MAASSWKHDDVHGIPVVHKQDRINSASRRLPTKWGLGGRARYLDALLRDGATP